MIYKIIKTFLNTRLASNLIDKYLEKQSTAMNFAKKF